MVLRVLAARAIARPFLALSAVALLVVLIGSALPSPKGAHLVDLDVRQDVRHHAIIGGWSLAGPPAIEDEPARWVNLGAWAANSLSFGFSDSQEVRFQLETEGGRVLQVRDAKTGPGGPLTFDKSLHVVFREVEPGALVLRVSLMDGARVQETTTSPFTVVREGA